MQDWIDTKAELQEAITTHWSALESALGQLTDAQMTELTDAQGWNVRDHLTHLAAWERSVVYLLQGGARYDGLGIDEALYRSGDFDAMNDVIVRRQRDLSPAAAQAQLRAVHSELLALLEPLDDADLLKPVRAYSSHEHGARAERAVMDVIYGNTAEHFAEHLTWMQALLTSD